MSYYASLMEIATASREELRAHIERLEAALSERDAVIWRLEARIEALEAGTGKATGKPKGLAGNKLEPSRPDKPKGPRKKRDRNFVRRRTQHPDERVAHAYEECPVCGTGLGGGSVKRTRQVIEVRPSPAVVIEHAYIERCCPCCERRCTPRAQLSGVVVGRSRLGVGLVGLIATLREVCRLPVRTIWWYLDVFHGLTLSDGAIVGALRSVAGCAAGLMRELREGIRASPHAHGDETGWREDGDNGYVWTFSTPNIRLFVRRGRDQGVVREMLGLDAGEGAGFSGVLISDFYAGYNCYLGPHQRCWAHLLRDVRDLVEMHPDDKDLAAWAQAVRAEYIRGTEWVARYPDEPEHIRLRAQLLLEDRLKRACVPHLTGDAAVLCRRIHKHIKELFVFVAEPGVPADNNAAERSLRPLVTARKISADTRSKAGTDTKMTLASAFGTWLVRGLNPYHACLSLLTSPQS